MQESCACLLDPGELSICLGAGELLSKLRTAKYEQEKIEREQRLLETQLALAKEAARKDRIATRTIESQMADMEKLATHAEQSRWAPHLP